MASHAEGDAEFGQDALFDMLADGCHARSAQLVLLEGAYGPQDLLHDGLITALFYLEAPLWLRMIRRVRRDRQERGRNPIQIIQHMLWHMIPGERTFIRPMRSVSGLVITNPRQGQMAAIEYIQTLLNPTSVM